MDEDYYHRATGEEMPPLEYCEVCGFELPDHEHDCPRRPDGPEVLPYDLEVEVE